MGACSVGHSSIRSLRSYSLFLGLDQPQIRVFSCLQTATMQPD